MPAEPEPYGEDYWRDFLTRGDGMERRARSLFKHLPSDPRCDSVRRRSEVPGRHSCG